MACIVLGAALLLGPLLASAQLVGPGAVTSFTGGGSRSRGYGTVRDPAQGFFVAGSSLADLNGIYHRVQPSTPGEQPHLSHHSFQLAYLNDQSGWYLGLVHAPGGAHYEATGGKPAYIPHW